MLTHTLFDLFQSKDGEPVVTVLSPGPIRVKDSHFSRPRGSSDLLRAPSRFPVPQSRVVLREISVVWHLYGGKDFGGKPMSIHAQHANRYHRQGRPGNLVSHKIYINDHDNCCLCVTFSLLSFDCCSLHLRPPLSTGVVQSLLVFVGLRLALSLPLVRRTPGAGLEAAGVSTRC